MNTEILGKPNKTIEDLGKLMIGSEIKDFVIINGVKFWLETLNYDSETWADQFVRTKIEEMFNTEGAISLIKQRRVPYIAAAITGIQMPNGELETKEQLFSYPDDMSKELVEQLESNPVNKKYWLNKNMLLFFAQKSNAQFIEPLWSKYQQMLKRRALAVNEIENLSVEKKD